MKCLVKALDVACKTGLLQPDPMSPPFSLEHIGLAAQDTTALKDWYVRVMGARGIYNNGTTPPAYFMELPGGVSMEIYQGNYTIAETADNGQQGWRYAALSVESIDAAKTEL